MKITSKLTMELTHHCSSPIIYAAQDDKYSRELELTLLENGKPWCVPQDATVLIRYCKADGTGGTYNMLPDERTAWSASENILTLTLAPQVLTAAGAVRLAVTLMDNDIQITTFSIIVSVEGAIHALSGESQDYFHVPGFLPAPPVAEAGQYLQVSSVDASGHITGLRAATPGKNNQAFLEPAEDDIPKVFFGAALPQTKDDTIMSFRYISKTEDISGYCMTKAQGNHSMNYPKKNQTVKLYKDAECTEKLKVNFKGWGEQNKFCFKANWIDLTHARNIVSARLWGDVVKSRTNYSSIPEQLRTSPNHGAVDGFSVKVYANGIYQGRYTINIPKDAWMASMDDKLDNHCILCGENYVSGCFRAEANIDGSDWTDEVHKTVPASIKNRWNEAIRFVMNSTNDEFMAGIGNFFDVQSLIDYYIFGLVSCGLDAFGKNQLYMTYDGQKWYAQMYDMDSTWGLWYNGSSFVAYNYGRNEYQDFKDGNGNLLYIRLESLFDEAIKARWEELKTSALSIENIVNRLERFTDIAPPYLVAEDYADTTSGGAFTAIPQKSANTIQQLRAFAANRFFYVDSVLGGESDGDSKEYSIVWGGWSGGDYAATNNVIRARLNPVVLPIPDGVAIVRCTIPDGFYMGATTFLAVDPTADYSAEERVDKTFTGLTRLTDPGWQAAGVYDLPVGEANMFGCNFKRADNGTITAEDIALLNAGFSFEMIAEDESAMEYEVIKGVWYGNQYLTEENPVRGRLNPVLLPTNGATTVRFTIPSGFFMGATTFTADDPSADYTVAPNQKVTFTGLVMLSDPGWQSGTYDLDVSNANMFACNFKRSDNATITDDDFAALNADFYITMTSL